MKQVKDPSQPTPKSPETHDSKSNNAVRGKKLSSASQRTLNRKRSQQHLDSQLRNDGDETEEDLLLNEEKNNRNKRSLQNNDVKNSGLIKNGIDSNSCNGNEIQTNSAPSESIQTKTRKSRKSSKVQRSTNDVEIKTPNQEVPTSISHNQGSNGDALQNCVKRGGSDCQDQLSSNHFQDVSNVGTIDQNERAMELRRHQQIPNEKNVSFSHDVNEFLDNSEFENNKLQKKHEKENSLISTSFEQPDIVSWLPLLSKTSAMQCQDKDENDTKPFRSNVEIPFASSNLRNNVVKRNTFNCDEIASPKLAARHAMMLERNAAKQAAISQRRKTPSLCFDVTASENSDNECQNNTSPLL